MFGWALKNIALSLEWKASQLLVVYKIVAVYSAQSAHNNNESIGN